MLGELSEGERWWGRISPSPGGTSTRAANRC